MLELLVVLVATAASLDCNNNDAGYTLPCNKNLDPWKETREKFDGLASELEEADDPDVWTRIEDGKEVVETVLGSHEAITETADALSEILSSESAEDAVDAAAEAAEEIAEKAKGATKWLKKGATALKALATAAQFVGPILDIILLFAAESKSDELVAIEAGFAKMGAKIDSLAHQVGNVQDAVEWNTVAGKLMEFEANVQQITKKYKNVVQAIKAADLSREMPLSVKGLIEDLVEAVKNSGGIGNKMEMVNNLFQGNSAFTKGKNLLEIFVESVDNDCSQILPLSSKLISIVKDAQRLQYFYEINQQLIKPNDDKGYPKMVYEMYKTSMAVYEKCTKSAVVNAQKTMQMLYANDEELTAIIDKMEPMYELYNWATMKEDDKEEENFALVDNSAGKLNVELTGISEDEQEKQRLTIFAVKKASKIQVADAIKRIKQVLASLKKEDLPVIEVDDYGWDIMDQKGRDELLDKVRDILKKDNTIKSMMEDQGVTMAMFKNDTSKISLTGWHFKTNVEVFRVEYGQSWDKEKNSTGIYVGFTVGFLFNFRDDTNSFKCTNGNRRTLSIDGSFSYCLCNFGYGGEACDILLNDAPKSTLSSSVLKVVNDYKVPGMFDLQSDIKKGTEAVLHGIEDSKLEIFSEIKNSGRNVEKSKNAILSAQSMMLDQMRADNSKILKGLTGLQSAMEAAFERERNDRIYRTEQGQKVVMKAISDSNKAITEGLQRVTGKVIENRYFKELKIYIPVYQGKFEDAISYGGFAEFIFSKYLETNEHNFQSAKDSAKKAMVEKTDSFVTAQMQINMISGCTDEYTEKIKSTWAEMMELHLAMTTMEFWNLDYKIKTSSTEEEAEYWNHQKALLNDRTKSETDNFKEIVRSRGCPAFSLPDLLGGGCEASITYPGQVVPMQCKDSAKTLLLLSSNEAQSEISCNDDSKWAVDMADLECIPKCKDGDEYLDIGDKKRLPDAPSGYFFADDEGLKITESTCVVQRPRTADSSHRVLNDIDFSGADLYSLSGLPTIKDCLARCARDARCVSVTHHSPSSRCWLKFKQFGERTRPLEGYDSANLDITGSRWIQKDIDFRGADIRMESRVLSIYHCLALCEEHSGCVAVTIQPATSRCWLKSKEGGANTVLMDGVESANLKSSKWVQKDTDFGGADIRSVGGVNNIRHCLRICAQEVGCVSVSHKPDVSTCWLKYKEYGQTTRFMAGVNSANLKYTDPRCVQRNVDYNSADLKMVQFMASIEECLEVCSNEAGCVSVTHQPSSSNCWLKTKKFGAVPLPMDGVNSANLGCEDVAGKSSWKNLAFNQTAEQVDDYNDVGTASKAVDGNRKGRWAEQSVTHTASNNGWWKVTLSRSRYISYIDVYNRIDCCQNRLKNARVFIDGELIGLIHQENGIQRTTIPVFRRGQVVKIETVSGTTLNLAEVEVYGLHAGWSVPHKIDINECADAEFCNPGGTCKNTFGSFVCTCAAGYDLKDDGKCHDVNECAVGSLGYEKCLVQSNLGTCMNHGGSYSCGCLSGSYTTPGHHGKECVACTCNSNGVTSDVCDKNTGACLCNPNVGGADCGQCKEGFTNFPYCTKCAAGYFGYPACNKCSCTDSGVTAQQCDPQTGACLCKDGVAGKTCDVCKAFYKYFPSCVPDVQDGVVSPWGAWSEWVDEGKCGPSYMKGYIQKRTRTRSCDDSSKNIHGRSCSGDNLVETQTRFNNVCKPVTGVFITLHTNYHAGTTADLWMGVRQGSIQCTTSRPTWDAPDEEDWQITYWKGAHGCSNTFDETKPVSIYLYSDSSNDVYVTRMGAKIGETVKTWHSGGSYTAIDSDERNGWYTTK